MYSRPRAIAALLPMLMLVTLFPGCAMTRRVDNYERSPENDGVFAYRLVEVQHSPTDTTYVVELTSQEWRGHEWKHWLTVVRPRNLRHQDTALLLIAGGNIDQPGPGGRARALADAARATGSVAATVEQVPNQPLEGGLVEDYLIAYTFDKYLRGEGDDWPLLLPMVKSATRAMDAIQELAREEWDSDIQSFVLTGGSKRGWTAWLAAARDDRVAGVAPMVIDMLNLGPQMRKQLRDYGAYSEAIHPYTDLGIQNRIDTPRGQKLVQIVDPYEHRESLDMPKLVILGTNDPYWTVDAANLYFPDLLPPKYLYYSANEGHGVDDGGIMTLTAFHQSILTGVPMPRVEWDRPSGGPLTVSWDQPETRVTLWGATSEDRDFRDALWEPMELETADRQVRVPLARPEEGFAAFYVEVGFAGLGPRVERQVPFSLCTLITVLGDD